MRGGPSAEEIVAVWDFIPAVDTMCFSLHPGGYTHPYPRAVGRVGFCKGLQVEGRMLSSCRILGPASRTTAVRSKPNL